MASFFYNCALNIGIICLKFGIMRLLDGQLTGKTRDFTGNLMGAKL
jgi:hypothetical protein